LTMHKKGSKIKQNYRLSRKGGLLMKTNRVVQLMAKQNVHEPDRGKGFADRGWTDHHQWQWQSDHKVQGHKQWEL